jgi:hypothetical protein
VVACANLLPRVSKIPDSFKRVSLGFNKTRSFILLPPSVLRVRQGERIEIPSLPLKPEYLLTRGLRCILQGQRVQLVL